MANTKLIKANKHPPIINIIVIDKVRAASGKLGLFVGLDGVGNSGLRDGCMDGKIDNCLDGCLDGGVDGCLDGGVDGSADGCLESCADGLAGQIAPLIHEFLAACNHSERLQQLNEMAPENIEAKESP